MVYPFSDHINRANFGESRSSGGGGAEGRGGSGERSGESSHRTITVPQIGVSRGGRGRGDGVRGPEGGSLSRVRGEGAERQSNGGGVRLFNV